MTVNTKYFCDVKKKDIDSLFYFISYTTFLFLLKKKYLREGKQLQNFFLVVLIVKVVHFNFFLTDNNSTYTLT